MMRAVSRLVLIVVAIFVTSPQPDARAAGVEDCPLGEESEGGSEPEPITFLAFRPGFFGSDVFYRDLELLWDTQYSGGLTGDVQTTLRNFIYTLVDSAGKNPFGINAADYQLIYEYFRYQGSNYTLDPRDTTSVVFGHSFWVSDIGSYNPSDRSHVDLYLFDPARGLAFDGIYPSQIRSGEEDLTTGHSTDDVKRGNSLMTKGPPAGSPLDIGGTGWTRPGGRRNTIFNHEFQHGLPGQPYFNVNVSEMLSAGAEAVGGDSDTTSASSEVPYTWSLLARTAFGGDLCANPRGQSSNYLGRTLFTSYLAYNFRGADTSSSIASINDDLLRKWARSVNRTLASLRFLLSNDSCSTCATKSYFNPGGVPMLNEDRLQLLLHHWRVASFVNKSLFDEGQYGFPPHMGFVPSKQLRAWQDFDGCGTDDIVAIPPVVTLSRAQAVRETVLARTRTFRGTTLPLQLAPLGAEYWVIRSDATLSSGTQDLVVRVAPQGIFRLSVPTRDGRLMASVVAYTQADPGPADESFLWNRPDLAGLAIAPQWVDVDSTAGLLEFVVPNFGTTYKAAVVIITLGDGPSQYYSGQAGIAYLEALRYRLSAAVRTAPYDATSPQALVQTAGFTDDQPAWSPLGDEVVFVRGVQALGRNQLYRKKLDATAASPLLPSPTLGNHLHPDWSPRGDWIAFERDTADSENPSDLWLFNTTTDELLRLTTAKRHQTLPGFSPNGQQVAYASESVYQGSNTPHWQIRKINLDGSNDVLLIDLPEGVSLTALRWSPSGSHIYYLRDEILFAVSSNGGGGAPRTSVLSKATTFDLSLGAGPIVMEQPGFSSNESIAGGAANTMPFRRMALRDTVRGDTLVRFYRTGVQYYNPRLSFDGTRVAYSADPNVAGDRELFVGQVSFNHRPNFNDLYDQSIPACESFDLTVGATDPDGETVSYQVLYKPAGSTFSGNLFRWTNPQVGTYYVLFRALDPSGGVHNKVIQLNVYDSEGCGLLMAGDGGKGGGEYSMAGATENAGAVAETYRLAAMPVAATGHYRLGLPADATAITDLDRVRFIAVDHEPDSRVFPTGQGAVVGVPVAAVGVNDDSGTDVTEQVSHGGGEHYSGGSGDVLFVNLGPQASPSGDAAIVIEAGGVGAADQGILVQVPDGAGAWLTVQHLHPRRQFVEYAVGGITSSTVRLAFLGDHAVRFVGRIAETETVDRHEPALLTATHSRLGAVTAALMSEGGATASMASADTVTVEFSVPSRAPEVIRHGLLSLRGTLPAPGGGGSTLSSRVPSSTPERPLTFALHQNLPNPFEMSTTVSFDLPVTAPVRLRVFDAQGRLVRVLAEGSTEPGYHRRTWDRTDERGERVAPGVYLYRLEAGAFRAQRKLIVLP
jgi:hypothetical protein